MDDIGENSFITLMVKYISNMLKVNDASRIIEMKELIIKKQFMMINGSL